MNYLNKYLSNNKAIPIDKFFYNVLYNKKNGYYIKKNPIGKNGDFITSPMISFLFSEMIAVWIVSYWESLNKPKKFNIIELGPGTGKLYKDLIKTFKKFPNFYSSSNFYLYEKSTVLKNLQKNNLHGEKISWISNFNEIKKGQSIFFGNEFFDAIPIKQFKRKKNKIFEKFIKINNSKKIEIIFKSARETDTKQLKKFNLFKNNDFVEFPKLGLKELKFVVKKIKKSNGGLLLIDYGYLNQINIDTLQSVKNHKKNNIFKNLGDSDITSLVNFSLLKNYFKDNDLKVNNVVTQSFFLKKVGILERAEIVSKKMSFKEKSDLFLRLKRLLDAKHMGEIFKVIFAYKGKKEIDLGFN